MGGNTFEGLLALAGITAMFSAAIGAILYWRALRDGSVEIAHRLRTPAPTSPRPAGPPIERIAADARRIRAELRSHPAGVPVARLDGWQQAYDDVLVSGCRALQLDDQLAALPRGAARDAERERVELMLERSGLRIRSAA